MNGWIREFWVQFQTSIELNFVKIFNIFTVISFIACSTKVKFPQKISFINLSRVKIQLCAIKSKPNNLITRFDSLHIPPIKF